MPKPFSTPPPQTVILSEAEGRVEGPAAAGCPILDSFTVKGGNLRSRRLPTLSRLLKSATLACILLLTLGAADPTARFNKIGHEMVCTCGCGQILLECNHVGCPVSGPMINELRGLLGGGGGGAAGVGISGGDPGAMSGGNMSDTSIFNWFAAKYGATVLAAPIRGGFDNVAWIMPISVFFLATIGTAVLIRVWKLRSAQTPVRAAALGNAAARALRDRIRKETEY